MFELIAPDDQRYIDQLHREAHPSLGGVPIGATIIPREENMFRRMYQGDIKVLISPQEGTQFYGNRNCSVPKEVFLGLPANRRHKSVFPSQRISKISLSEDRAREILAAVHKAIHRSVTEQLKNPFRIGDSEEIAVPLVLAADFSTAIKSNDRGDTRWLSRFQAKEEAMVRDPDTHMCHIAHEKLVSPQVDWYINVINRAVKDLLRSNARIDSFDF